MPNTQTLRRRIKSVKNTRQITKAMELVSASKMRRAQERVLQSRNYSAAAQKALALLSQLELNHPFLSPRKIDKALYVIITSDRGLAGAYNSAVLKKSLDYIRDKNIPHEIVTIGKKAEDFFKLTNIPFFATFTHIDQNLTSSDIYPISKLIVNSYKKKQFNKVVLIYTHFGSTVNQVVTIKNIFPLDITEPTRNVNEYTLDQMPKDFLEYIVPRLIESLIYQALLESNASEHSARMIAMKNASDNAKEIIDDMNLEYNSARQASITQELAEITSGAAALQ